MLQIIAFVVVLGMVYAVKAVCIARQHDDLAAQSTSFSWMRPRDYEDIAASAEAMGEELSLESEERHVAVPSRVPSLA